uniref:Uncharacterized protein n=1 Tax=Setaria italica TaxID=4555 RepID=K3XN91_SETIT
MHKAPKVSRLCSGRGHKLAEPSSLVVVGDKYLCLSASAATCAVRRIGANVMSRMPWHSNARMGPNGRHRTVSPRMAVLTFASTFFFFLRHVSCTIVYSIPLHPGPVKRQASAHIAAYNSWR